MKDNQTSIVSYVAIGCRSERAIRTVIFLAVNVVCRGGDRGRSGIGISCSTSSFDGAIAGSWTWLDIVGRSRETRSHESFSTFVDVEEMRRTIVYLTKGTNVAPVKLTLIIGV